MKPCEKYIDLIQRSVDGELSEGEKDILNAHLAACPGCKAIYDTYEHIQKGIMEGEEAPPAALSGAVMKAICREKEERKPLTWLKRSKFTLIAAAAVLVIFLVGKNVNLDFGASSADISGSAAAEATVDEAEAAGAAAAEDGAAFQMAPEMVEAEEEAAWGETAEEPADAPAEAPAAAPAEAAETAPMATGTGESQAVRWTIKEVWEDLRRDGYSGDLYQLTMTEKELLELLPDCERIALSTGPVVYRSSVEDFQSVQLELRSNCSIVADVESDDVFYWMEP